MHVQRLQHQGLRNCRHVAGNNIQAASNHGGCELEGLAPVSLQGPGATGGPAHKIQRYASVLGLLYLRSAAGAHDVMSEPGCAATMPSVVFSIGMLGLTFLQFPAYACMHTMPGTIAPAQPCLKGVKCTTIRQFLDSGHHGGLVHHAISG